MAIEKIGQMTYVDEAGNEYLLFPKTKPECIPGVAEHLANTNNPHGVTIEQIGAAPAGYGLGSADSKQLSTADDLNNCGANGFYSWALSPINAPFPNGMMIVATYDWARKIQYIWSAENGCAVQRIQHGASWGEPECVNPPMVPGVEYRTTERFNGKPVYTKYVECGALPNASNKREVIVPTGSTIIGIDGYSVYTSGVGNEIYTPLVKTDGVTSFFVNQTTGQVGINTDTDLSTYTATVTVKYTK